MKLWADVYDNSYTNLQGPGPIDLINARVKRVLDGPGSCSIEVAATDERVLEYMTVRKVIEIWYQSDTITSSRRLGTFIIEKIAFSDDTRQTVTISGPDRMGVLRDRITYLPQVYQAETFDNIVQDLKGNGFNSWSAWSVVDPALASKTLATRFDGQSVLKALQTLCSHQGAHFRYNGSNRIFIGYFGEQIDTRIEAVEGTPQAGKIINNGDIAVLKRIEIVEDSANVVNAVLPTGGGNGELYLTLENSTRSGITLLSRNGKAERWIEDSNSISEFGRIERRLNVKEISPVSNSSSDVTAAANALFDAAEAELDRIKEPQTIYKVECAKLDENVRVGDKIPVIYRGTVLRNGQVTTTRNVTGWYWVLSVEEKIGSSGQSVTMEVSNIDRWNVGAAAPVLGAIDAIEINGVTIQPYPSKTNIGPYQDDIDLTHSATVPIDITESTLNVTRCYVRFTTRPFRANVQAVASSGALTSVSGGSTSSSTEDSHRHKAFEEDGSYASPGAIPSSFQLKRYRVKLKSGVGSYTESVIVLYSEAGAEDVYTDNDADGHFHTNPAHQHEIPSHSHAMDYGIYDDTNYPINLRLFIDGVDRTSALGGPWNGSSVDEEIEISDYFQGALQQRHTLEWRCDGGQGTVETTVELYETIQSIAVS